MKHIKTFESFVASINEEVVLTPQQRFALSINAISQKIKDLQNKAKDKPEEAIYIKAQIGVEQEKLDVIKAQIQADRIKTQMANRKELEKKLKDQQAKSK